MVRPVNAGSTAGGHQDRRSPEVIEDFLPHPVTVGAGHDPGSVFGSARFQVQAHDVHFVEDFHIGQGQDRVGQKGFDVLPVDLEVAVAPGHVLAVFIFEDDEPQVFEPLRHFIEVFTHGEEQVFSGNAMGISQSIVDIEVGGMPFGDVRVEGIDPRRKAAAAENIGFFHHQDPFFRVPLREGQCRITTGGSAADDEDIGTFSDCCHRHAPSYSLYFYRNSL